MHKAELRKKYKEKKKEKSENIKEEESETSINKDKVDNGSNEVLEKIYIRKKQREKYRVNTDENNRHNKSLSERSNFEKKYKFKGLYKSKNEEDNSLINGEENDKHSTKKKTKKI